MFFCACPPFADFLRCLDVHISRIDRLQGVGAISARAKARVSAAKAIEAQALPEASEPVPEALPACPEDDIWEELVWDPWINLAKIEDRWWSFEDENPPVGDMSAQQHLKRSRAATVLKSFSKYRAEHPQGACSIATIHFLSKDAKCVPRFVENLKLLSSVWSCMKSIVNLWMCTILDFISIQNTDSIQVHWWYMYTYWTFDSDFSKCSESLSCVEHKAQRTTWHSSPPIGWVGESIVFDIRKVRWPLNCENSSANHHWSFGSRKWWRALHNHHDALQLDKAKAVWFAETMTSRSRVHEVQAQRLFTDVHCKCLFATYPYIFNLLLHLQPIAIASRHVVDSCWLLFKHPKESLNSFALAIRCTRCTWTPFPRFVQTSSHFLEALHRDGILQQPESAHPIVKILESKASSPRVQKSRSQSSSKTFI